MNDSDATLDLGAPLERSMAGPLKHPAEDLLEGPLESPLESAVEVRSDVLTGAADVALPIQPAFELLDCVIVDRAFGDEHDATIAVKHFTERE